MTEEMKQMHFVPVAHCVFVKGASRTVMCDLQRQQIYIVPADMPDLLWEYKDRKIADIYADMDEGCIQVLNEYFSFLLDKEAIFLTPHTADIERFKSLPVLHEHYGVVQNAIIDMHNCEDWLPQVLVGLEQLGCQYIQFRFYSGISPDTIYRIARMADETEFRSLDFLAPYNETFEAFNFEHLLVEYQRIGSIILYSAPEDKTEIFLCSLSSVCFSKKIITDCNACGVTGTGHFMTNIPHYMESQNHNTCLNRKISIDVDGNIKNCPSMPESFGNIKDTTLAEAIGKPGFKKYWNITKDQINVCRVCEFRHICTDCRAYIETPEDIYSKPLKCGYNPYTCEWEEWSTNPLKQHAIAYYDLTHLSTIQ